MILRRSQIAKLAHRAGVTRLLLAGTQSPCLIALCYHRIGDPREDCYDPHVYSCTAEEFDDQVAYLKRAHGIATVDEVLADFGTRRWKRARVLLTFDDGYIDNYTTAFRVLRSHGVQGTFLLASDFVGTAHIPWWDAICHMIAATSERYIRVPCLTSQVFDKRQEGPGPVMRRILKLFFSAGKPDANDVLGDLERSTGISCAPTGERRFLSWEEAREMQQSGMEIGAHSVSHRLLGHLSIEEQRREIAGCRERMLRDMGVAPRVFAPPCGSGSPETRELIEAAGYSLSLSIDHGANRIPSWDPLSVRRVHVNHDDVKEVVRLKMALLSSGVSV